MAWIRYDATPCSYEYVYTYIVCLDSVRWVVIPTLCVCGGYINYLLDMMSTMGVVHIHTYVCMYNLYMCMCPCESKYTYICTVSVNVYELIIGIETVT